MFTSHASGTRCSERSLDEGKSVALEPTPRGTLKEHHLVTHTRSLVFVGSLIALAACNNPPQNPQPDGSGNDAAVTPDAMDNDGHVEMDGAMGPDGESDASAPPEDGVRSEDWGFRPRPHGFAFENYTNMDMPTNLTPVEMRRVFGPQVCEGGAAMGACTLVPQAAQWMQQQNAGMNGGHCEGMAVVASLFYTGALPVGMFGMGTNAGDLGLMGNDALQREIAMWFVTQSTLPMLERRNLTPSQVIDEFSRDLSGGRAFGGTVLGIYKRDGGGGHAITPYALRRPDAQTVEVLSYDNNYANVERVLTVNLGTNTWSYNASTNPMEPSSMYEGDATTFNLTLADITPRTMFPHACTFCGDIAMDGGGMRAVQVSLRGAANLSISDGMGHITGYDSSGNEVDTIPGATLQRSRSASLYTDSPEPTYTVPHATPLTITLDGTRLACAEPSDVLVTGPWVLARRRGRLARSDAARHDHRAARRAGRPVPHDGKRDADDRPRVSAGGRGLHDRAEKHRDDRGSGAAHPARPRDAASARELRRKHLGADLHAVHRPRERDGHGELHARGRERDGLVGALGQLRLVGRQQHAAQPRRRHERRRDDRSHRHPHRRVVSTRIARGGAAR